MNEPKSQLSRRLASLVWLSVCCMLPLAAQALPDDAQQPIEMDWIDNEFGLDEGKMILYGTDAEPASIRQGSLQITGTEIQVQIEGDAITKVTATGRPGRFRQQLEPGQEPLQANGLTLVFDNSAQMLLIDGEVEVIHAGTRTQVHHFEYDFKTRRFRSSGAPDGERGRMVVQPPEPQ
jgi:lipopolysaccharide transport protein LptA